VRIPKVPEDPSGTSVGPAAARPTTISAVVDIARLTRQWDGEKIPARPAHCERRDRVTRMLFRTQSCSAPSPSHHYLPRRGAPKTATPVGAAALGPHSEFAGVEGSCSRRALLERAASGKRFYPAKKLWNAGMESLAPAQGIGSPSLLERYQPLIGARATERLLKKAGRLKGLKVLHVNSTRQGGGVAEILSSVTPLMTSIGLEAQWLVIDGSPEFFALTKDIHNGLQGDPIQISREGMHLHRNTAHANAAAAALEGYDIIFVHDPQPLPLVELRQGQRWIWCCHIDLSAPNPDVWSYLATNVERYDAAIFSLSEYAQPLNVPQRFIMPAIDPFSLINQEITRADIAQRLERYQIPRDLPLVVQAGRFDKWKDPTGVIEAFAIASQQRRARLVLVGNTAADDPEGPAMYESIRAFSSDRVLIIAADDPLLVNALQRRATVVLQKSLREGFGLTVSEAMWKRRAVLGGNVGGIRHQIVEGNCGFLVDSVQQTADRIGLLLDDQRLRRSMGRRAVERVRRHFLLTRLLEEWLDLFAALTARRRTRQELATPAWR
jgi:trehalose synthase